ncbi:hypothetical protein QC820_16775, partial [Halomonas mongoliensis]
GSAAGTAHEDLAIIVYAFCLLVLIGDDRTITIWRFAEDDMEEWLAESAFGVRGELGLGTAALESEMQRLETIAQEGN